MKDRKRLIGILAAAAVLVAAVLIVVFAVIRPLNAQRDRSEAALSAILNSTPVPTEAPTPTPAPTPLPPWRVQIIRRINSKNTQFGYEEIDADGRLLVEEDSHGVRKEYVYNDAGLKVKATEYSSKDKARVVAWTEYRYDADGRELDRMTYGFDDGEPYLKKQISRQYDEHGNMLRSEISSRNDGLYEWEDYTYTYDEAGRVLKSVCVCTHITDGSYTETCTNRYDERGNLVECNEKTESKIPEVSSSSSREVYEYDEKDRVIKTTTYFDGELSNYATREYDENGTQRWLRYYDQDNRNYSTTEYDENGEIIDPDVRLEYDENGRIIRRYDDDEFFDWRGEYSYDEEGRLVRIDYYNSDNEFSNYVVYEYLY